MEQFNFLSGSSIDNTINFLYDSLSSEQCYLGFAKGSPKNQWGINTLINIKHTVTSFPISAVAVSGDGVLESKFYDNNSIIATGAVEGKQSISIAKYTVADTNFTTPMPVSGLGTLTLSYLGSKWAVIQGLNQNWYDLIKYDDGYVYYIQDYKNDKHNQLKINAKQFTGIPFYSITCELWMKPQGGSNYILVNSNLQKIINILGETYITGLSDPTTISDSDINGIFNMGVSASSNKNTLLYADYQVRNLGGDILVDGATFVDPEVGGSEIYTEVTSYSSSQKYLTLKYTYSDNYQYIKLIVGANQIDSLAIWQEALPYTSIYPTADANPPALEISYLKNPNFHSSIFDVNGLSKIISGEISFVKEIFNTTEKTYYENAGFEIDDVELVGENITHSAIVSVPLSAGTITNTIQVYDFHSIVVGDSVFIPYYPQSAPTVGSNFIVTSITKESVTFLTNINISEDLLKDTVITSDLTTVSANISLAKTSDKEKALSYGFYNVLITKTVPISNTVSGSPPVTIYDCPTKNIYRQLFISYNPKTSLGSTCVSGIYSGDNTAHGANFNTTTWKYDNGLILYLANKLPVYRKWANSNEQFKIIL